MTEFIWPFDDSEPVENQLQAHMWTEDDVVTIGHSNTHWLSSDTAVPMPDHERYREDE